MCTYYATLQTNNFKINLNQEENIINNEELEKYCTIQLFKIPIVSDNISNIDGEKKLYNVNRELCLSLSLFLFECLNSVKSSKNTFKFVPQEKFNQRVVNFVVNGFHSYIVDEKDLKKLFNDFRVEIFSRRTLDRKIDGSLFVIS